MLKNIYKKIFQPFECWLEKKLQLALQMNEFINAPKEELSSYVESETNIKDIIKEIQNTGVPLIENEIDVTKFKDWMRSIPELVNIYQKSGEVMIEKLLEHYFVFEYLHLKDNEIYIDIASAGMPFSDILRGMGYAAYSQDLIFKKGINGFDIGGDASSMDVDECFANVLSLQCAFECFQGISDIGFIKEASRVLKKGGRLGIAPLYLDNTYFVKTGPKCDKREISIEKEANWIWRDDNYLHEPFSRHYSPEAFKKRVYNNLLNMEGEILHFTNLDELMSEFKDQRIYCHFMFRGKK